jgi:hypothetical protein
MEELDHSVEAPRSKFGRELRIALWMAAFVCITRIVVVAFGDSLGEHSATIATLAGALIGLFAHSITADAWRDGNEADLRLLKVMLLGCGLFSAVAIVWIAVVLWWYGRLPHVNL